MRLLHTADWHLGRQFEGWPLEEDHDAILNQVLNAVFAHHPDAIVIAGDIFDRSAPPERAVRHFNDFLHRIATQTEAAIVLIAGNHDSGDRIGAMAALADRRRVLIRGPVSADEPPLVLADAAGPVAFSALPFANEFAARECFGNHEIRSPADVMAAQVAAARKHVPANARWIVIAHAFVEGSATSEVERPLARTVGGIETVPASVFDGATYVALGHLHRPQNVGSARIRYSGSPLAFGFDEAGEEKSMTIVDIDASGEIETTPVPFVPIRQVRILRGSLEQLLAAGRLAPSDDFVRPILTDATRLIDPMKRLRDYYPRACGLAYEHELLAPEVKSIAGAVTKLADPASVAADFIAFTHQRPVSEAERLVIDTALAALHGEAG